MKTIKNILFTFVIVLCVNAIQAQTIKIKGRILANADLEGVHVLNLTAEAYTVTNTDGVFVIEASEQDSILISSVQYIPKTITISKSHIELKWLEVVLEDRVNELDEVIVGKVLTGDLGSDIKNSDTKRDINFYDVGIPGYTGKPKTQKERRVLDADGGKFVYYYGLVATINIHKILNRISGRTNKLKHIARLEQQDMCMNKAIADVSDDLFGHVEIELALKTTFFYYASEDPEFLDVCKENNKFKMYEFLVTKLINFQEQVESVDD